MMMVVMMMVVVAEYDDDDVRYKGSTQNQRGKTTNSCCITL